MRSSEHLFSHPDISFLQQAKLQAQVLVPVLRALRERLGEDEANQLVSKALRDWSRAQFENVARSSQNQPGEQWQSIWTDVFAKVGDGLEFEMLRDDKQSQDFNVTRCPYAEFFLELNEPELGAILLCEQDVHLAEAVGGDDVEFKRSQTIMSGAKYCDFRIKLRDASAK